MNFILSGADGVGDWLWRTSWQSAVLALLVLVTQGLFRQHLTPAWRYRLWLLVVLRLVLPISPESSTSVFNLARLRPALPMTPLVRPTAAAPSPVDLSAPVIAPRKGASPTAIAIPIASTVLPPAERQIASRAEAPSSLRPAPSTGSRLYACLPWMWALGVAWLIGRTAWQVVRFGRRLRTEATPASAEVERQFAQCREQLSVRQRVTLVETSLVSSPALYGLFRVRLLLPVGLTARFSADDLRYVLLHELAHLKQREHDKAFYALCTHIEPDYHQLEFDLRLYLIQLDLPSSVPAPASPD